MLYPRHKQFEIAVDEEIKKRWREVKMPNTRKKTEGGGQTEIENVEGDQRNGEDDVFSRSADLY